MTEQSNMFFEGTYKKHFSREDEQQDWPRGKPTLQLIHTKLNPDGMCRLLRWTILLLISYKVKCSMALVTLRLIPIFETR